MYDLTSGEPTKDKYITVLRKLTDSKVYFNLPRLGPRRRKALLG